MRLSVGHLLVVVFPRVDVIIEEAKFVFELRPDLVEAVLRAAGLAGACVAERSDINVCA